MIYCFLIFVAILSFATGYAFGRLNKGRCDALGFIDMLLKDAKRKSVMSEEEIKEINTMLTTKALIINVGNLWGAKR